VAGQLFVDKAFLLQNSSSICILSSEYISFQMVHHRSSGES